MAEILDKLIGDIRRPILSGAYLPGSRLPNRAEMVETYKVSSATVQLAIEKLKHDGFLMPRGKCGTYVRPHPPHLFRYGIVFCWPSDPGVLYVRDIEEIARAITGTHGRTVEVYHPLRPRDGKEEHQRLLNDITAYRLAGIIFVGSPEFCWADSPILTFPGIPRMQVTAPCAVCPGVPAILMDPEPFFDVALVYLAHAGRKRAARLSVDDAINGHARDFPVRAAAVGMETRPYWCQGVSWQPQCNVRGLAHLMFHAGQSERPDALVIDDDNLVEGALLGLADAGVRVPDDVAVVAQANFPILPPVDMSVKWFGYDLRYVVDTALDVLNRIRRREEAQSIRMSAVLEGPVPTMRAGHRDDMTRVVAGAQMIPRRQASADVQSNVVVH